MAANGPNRRTRIVILGGGFAGAYCAQELERRVGDDVEIVLINRHNYFIFYPLLVEAGMGALQPRHALVGIRSFLKRTQFIMAEIVDVELPEQEVMYQVAGEESPRVMHYDHLVVALGSVTNLPNVPGLKEHGYEMKSLAHAVGLRDRAVQLLETASLTADPHKRRAMLTMVVVGGSYTGVEVAGELNAYLRAAAKQYPLLRPDEVRVILVDRNKRILRTLDEDLSVWAAQHLRQRGVELRLEDTVTRIEPDCCFLKDGHCVETNTVVWCAGIAAPPVMQKIEVPRDRLGYILCEPDTRVKGYENVWGIGDCAVNPDPNGQAYPATAQHGTRLGVHCARNIASVLKGKPTRPLVYESQGFLAAFGYRDAVAKIGDVRLTGFPAWFMWRTVYLMKMPGLWRKFHVAWDWTADLLAPRDFVELGIHRIIRAAPQAAREEARDPKPEHEKGQTEPGKVARMAEAPG